MDRKHHLVYRMLIAVDIERYSVRDTCGQLLAQQILHRLLDRAAARAGLRRELWHRQVHGDGELAVLPDHVDVPRVVGEFTRGLQSELAALDQTAQPDVPLRLRLAMHHGTLTDGPFGPAGDAPVTVSRLLDSALLRRRLAERENQRLVLAISDSIYQDVVRTGFCALDPADFQAIRVRSKGRIFRGHVYDHGPVYDIAPTANAGPATARAALDATVFTPNVAHFPLPVQSEQGRPAMLRRTRCG